MQMKKAEALRKSWGEKPCDHPDLDKEYDLGADTGDCVCTTCGAGFTAAEADELRQRKERPSG